MSATINERVAFARERTGLSQRSLSKRAGLASAHVGLIESNRVETPDTKTVISIAKAAGVEASWLLFGVGPMIAAHPHLDPSNADHLDAITGLLRINVEVSRAVGADHTASDFAVARAADPVVVHDGFDQRTGTEG